MIKDILFVGIGGFLGSIARYLINIALIHYNWPIPWPTYVINLSGSLLIGILMAIDFRNAPVWRLLLITGLCGGFTTFSTFSYENLQLFRDGYPQVALFYMITSLGLGILMVFLGFYLTQRLLS